MSIFRSPPDSVAFTTRSHQIGYNTLARSLRMHQRAPFLWIRRGLEGLHLAFPLGRACAARVRVGVPVGPPARSAFILLRLAKKREVADDGGDFLEELLLLQQLLPQPVCVRVLLLHRLVSPQDLVHGRQQLRQFRHRYLWLLAATLVPVLFMVRSIEYADREIPLRRMYMSSSSFAFYSAFMRQEGTAGS